MNGCPGLGEGKQGVTTNGYEACFWGVENASESDIGDVYTIL